MYGSGRGRTTASVRIVAALIDRDMSAYLFAYPRPPGAADPGSQIHRQAEERGHQKQGEQRRQQQPPDHHASQAPVQLGPGPGEDDQRQHPQGARDRRHEDRPHAAVNRVADGLLERGFRRLPQDVERLVDDEDGVVDHHADEDDEAEHGEDVERLIGQRPVDDLQPENAPRQRRGHAEHDDERVEEALEEGGHQQIGDHQGQEEVPLQGLAGPPQVVGRAG